MSRNRAVVYITDAGFLMPSLFSAVQVATKTRASEMADILLVLVGVSPTPALVDCFSGYGISFFELDKDLFWRQDQVNFNKTHVPITSLGRLALQEVIPDRYEHILYLDGDTYIAGDIDALLAHSVAEGRIAAANDIAWVSRSPFGKFWRAHSSYCRGLGLTDAATYFNAGVLAFRMSTWREFAPRALNYFEQNSVACKYHDQSALNAVFRGRREILSPIWNFQTGYAELRTVREVEPRILHFTGGRKPWRATDSAWGPAYRDEYESFIGRHPALADLMPDSHKRGSTPGPRTGGASGIRKVVEETRKRLKRRAFDRYLHDGDFAV